MQPKLLALVGAFVLLLQSEGSRLTHAVHVGTKIKKETFADGAHYCSLIKRQIGNIQDAHSLETRLRIFSGLLKELIVVQDYQEQEENSGKTAKFPKCVETYKLVLQQHLVEIKKQNTDAYENATLLADYKYITGSFKEAKSSYSNAGKVPEGDINAGTKELASIVQVLSHEPKERDRIQYWQKDIGLIMKQMKKGNNAKPDILEDLKKMSKELGVKLARVLDSFFLKAAFADFPMLKIADFGVGVGHVEAGSEEDSGISQSFVRHKGFSQLIMTREDLMNLIQDMSSKGGRSLKRALGTLFPNAQCSSLVLYP